MTSLFTKIFWAKSVERTKLEDFLTELLADLLRRLPHSKQIEFCRDFLLRGKESAGKEEWLTVASNCKLSWETQVRVMITGAEHQKRPDIVLYGDDDPLMVIENKIGSNYTEGVITSGNGRTIKLGQLLLYDKWLRACSTRGRALVLLTHLVDPPPGFLDPTGKYTTQLRSVIRWADLYKWLKERGSALWPSQHQVLIEAFKSFLAENELMTESPTLTDLAATRLFLCGGSYNRITEAMTLARQAILTTYPKLKFNGWPTKPPTLSSSSEAGWLFDYCRVGKEPFISWGIFFISEDADWIDQYDPKISTFEGVYINVEFLSAVSRPEPGSFAGWHFPTEHERGQIFEAYKLCSFETVKGDFTTNFPTWVSDQFGEARQLISATH
jgi:hypothetical protein